MVEACVEIVVADDLHHPNASLRLWGPRMGWARASAFELRDGRGAAVVIAPRSLEELAVLFLRSAGWICIKSDKLQLVAPAAPAAPPRRKKR